MGDSDVTDVHISQLQADLDTLAVAAAGVGKKGKGGVPDEGGYLPLGEEFAGGFVGSEQARRILESLLAAKARTDVAQGAIQYLRLLLHDFVDAR